MKGKYPITRNGQLDCSRVRSALSYGAANNVTPALVKGGVCSAARKCDIEADVCKK